MSYAREVTHIFIEEHITITCFSDSTVHIRFGFDQFCRLQTQLIVVQNSLISTPNSLQQMINWEGKHNIFGTPQDQSQSMVKSQHERCLLEPQLPNHSAGQPEDHFCWTLHGSHGIAHFLLLLTKLHHFLPYLPRSQAVWRTRTGNRSSRAAFNVHFWWLISQVVEQENMIYEYGWKLWT